MKIKILSCAISGLHLSGYSDQLTDAEVPVFSPVDEEHDHTQERFSAECPSPDPSRNLRPGEARCCVILRNLGHQTTSKVCIT